MSVSEIRRRYRRTILGPFWVSINIGIFLLSLGVLYTKLWHFNVNEYFPYLSSGLILWGFISSTISEGCNVFIDARNFISQIKIPYTLFVFNIVFRNIILLFHTLIVYLIISFLFKVGFTPYSILFIPSLLLVFINGIWVVTVCGLLCSRFRDISQLISSLIQISFFITPIMWMPSQITNKNMSFIFILINPLYHIINILRAPLLGFSVSYQTWIIVLTMAILGNIYVIYLLSTYIRKIIFWI